MPAASDAASSAMVFDAMRAGSAPAACRLLFAAADARRHASA